jgi:hypothetical protein
VVVLSATLDDPSDLPLRTAFPIIVGNVLAWLDGRQGEFGLSARTGGTVELNATGNGLRLWSPDGRDWPCSHREDRLTAGPLDRCGVWRVAATRDAPPVATIACNLADPAESDLRPAAGLPGGTVADPRMTGRGTAPWFLLTAAAWGLALVEWRLFQRRWLG